MLAAEWKLAHSVLSSSMNLGLLHPAEVVEAATEAYRIGEAPINSVEGFVRQVIGWREYVWGVFWLWMPEYRRMNTLDANRPVPPVFAAGADTEMACVANAMRHLHDHGYTHHIERLMVLGNLALTSGVDPAAMTDWMWASFVDGAEWVMLPNVIGMALHADGGRMATKPYASGGAYINRMSDSCGSCRFDPEAANWPRCLSVHDALLGLPRSECDDVRFEPPARPTTRVHASALRSRCRPCPRRRGPRQTGRRRVVSPSVAPVAPVIPPIRWSGRGS